MKKVLVIVLLLSVMAGQAQNNNSGSEVLDSYKLELHKANKLKVRGIVFTSTGVASLVVGPILILTDTESYVTPLFGGLLFAYGLVGVGIGVPFWIVGSSRSKKLKKANGYSLTFGTTAHGVGLVIGL